MKQILTLLTLIFIKLTTLQAQVDPVNQQGIAIGGYDVVAYFKGGKALKGNEKYTFVHENVTYYFTSEENQKEFEDSPSQYLPQFDGYCALAVSYGKKISIDPETFKVSNNKLYLFYNGKTSQGKINSLETWNKNEDRLLKKATALWPDVQKSKYKPGSSL